MVEQLSGASPQVLQGWVATTQVRGTSAAETEHKHQA